MFQSITFYIGGKTLGIYGEEFPLGTLTTEVLNITPAEYQALDSRLQSAMEGMARYEKTHNLTGWHQVNAQMLRLNEALCHHHIFRLIQTDAYILTEAKQLTEMPVAEGDPLEMDAHDHEILRQICAYEDYLENPKKYGRIKNPEELSETQREWYLNLYPPIPPKPEAKTPALLIAPVPLDLKWQMYKAYCMNYAQVLKLGGFEPGEKITKRYNKTDADGRLYREEDLRKRGAHDERSDRPNLFYPFFYRQETDELLIGNNEDETPEGFTRIEPMKAADVEGTWRWGQETARAQKSYLHPRYMPNKKQWSLFEWEYLDERGDAKPTTLWDFKDVNSERGTEMFIKYLGFKKEDFPNPKPVGTIQRILQISTTDNDIVLDSFAGSGTTAQAVLALNKQDGHNRKVILLEMMDYADRITAERVKRVIRGYKNGKKAVEATGGSFSYYELGETLMHGDVLNENIGVEKIREYVYFTDTKCRLPEPHPDEPYFMGVHVSSAYYFYYEKQAVTTLNREFLHTVKTKADAYVIYADLCTLSEAELEKYHITFKKIPRDITKL